MRQKIKIPRIVKIEKISGNKIHIRETDKKCKIKSGYDTRAVSTEKRNNKILHYQSGCFTSIFIFISAVKISVELN